LSTDISKTYEEFPFTLTYEINGKRMTLEDTLICEYNGIAIDEAQGKFRDWKKRFTSGRSKILLYKNNNVKSINTDDYDIALKQEVYYDPGPAWYYMGDIEDEDINDLKKNNYIHNYPNASYYEEYQDGSITEGIIGAKKLFKRYGIKLIRWDCAPPIKNSFSEQ
jgi:hypothetical protein